MAQPQAALRTVCIRPLKFEFRAHMEPDPLRLYKQLDDLGVPKVRAKALRGEYSADALPVVHFWLKLHEKPHWSLAP